LFERFTERARQVVVLAQEEARTLKHNYIGTEHILLGLLREEEGLAARVLESLDITTERVRSQVVRIVGSGEEVTSGQIPFTPRAKKVLELALREALSLGHNYIGTEVPFCSAYTTTSVFPPVASRTFARKVLSITRVAISTPTTLPALPGKIRTRGRQPREKLPAFSTPRAPIQQDWQRRCCSRGGVCWRECWASTCWPFL
jgi:hypothetical protein